MSVWRPLLRISALCLCVAGCHDDRPPAPAIARLALVAIGQSDASLANSDTHRNASWAVHVSPSLREHAAIAATLERRLHARQALPADSLRFTLDIDGLRRVPRGVAFSVGVTGWQRCGPTWGSRVGFGSAYVVYTHAADQQWPLDSVRSEAIADPGICAVRDADSLPPTT